ncbi:hypothetical protein K457DRAFT_13010 [Linnemannia elongata AG-77]|uniref:Uncharacterized protein n=1 Tax=Linnemannia elongata AG-77 TaxID=1314771 RepID=A0A197KE56_9FUNG|nr:hypothetical protein K457DRAFT_13010 [Linnemannia elongata AG-77]
MSHLQAVQVTYEALIDSLQFKSFLRKSLKTAAIYNRPIAPHQGLWNDGVREANKTDDLWISIAVYELRFQAGLYLWVEIDTRYLPRDKNDTHCLIRTMELLVPLKKLLGCTPVHQYVNMPPRRDPDHFIFRRASITAIKNRSFVSTVLWLRYQGKHQQTQVRLSMSVLA